MVVLQMPKRVKMKIDLCKTKDIVVPTLPVTVPKTNQKKTMVGLKVLAMPPISMEKEKNEKGFW